MKTTNKFFTKAKLSLLLFFGLLVLVDSACVQLEQPPLSFEVPEQRDTNIPFTLKELEAKANQLYRDLWGGNYGYNTRMAFMSVGADATFTGKDPAHPAGLYSTEYLNISITNESDPVTWGFMYKAISTSSNLMMEILKSTGIAASQYGRDSVAATAQFNKDKYLELVEAGAIAKEDSIMYLLGEAYFVRALCYFDMVRFYGDVPCFADHTNNTSINGDVAKEKQIPRTPQKDVYEKMILRDLQLATSLLPATSRVFSGKSSSERPSKWAAKAMLADVYLTMAGWPLKQTDKYDLSAVESRDIIDGAGLSLTEGYRNLWLEKTKQDANEHMFALHHYTTLGSANTYSNYGKSYYAEDEKEGGQLGWFDILADSIFFGRWNSQGADGRRGFSIITTFKNPDKQGGQFSYTESKQKCPAIAKFRDYGGIATGQSGGITPIYRYAQVLLMYAEASNMAQGSPSALAYKCLRDVRERGGATKAIADGLSKEAFNEVVFDENGWELYAEGAKRWFQLLRTEKVVTVNQRNWRVKAELVKRGCTTEAQAQASQGYLRPIPPSVITTASAVGVTITQNPGY